MSDYKTKDFDPKAAAEARKKEMDEITEKLEKGVQEVFASEDYKKLLGVMAQMPHYSVNDRVEANRAPEDLGIDMAEFERITADCPFGNAEVDHPAGFIKIEPPFDPSTLAEPASIELKTAEKAEEKKEKTSVKEKLEAKKKESEKQNYQENHKVRKKASQNKRQEQMI